ncbi:pyridoxamine 5'-phosphate oxidase family protein [Histidinibacterium aquaticum]|uniref:General stress protein n=1 Tax=Histidinibacterium aquaticum TaxID=2613962 RepID=A0A5J5GQU5_9RHOB|nr:pyridoxamine 5'-phosphate oxidase family protein [Histidinibacterium aquaticum]KAA9010445.1 general stress protein [Histidinibacterium aquaticum]
MADVDRTTEDAKAQMFDQLSEVKAGMLGVPGSGQHMQPMTPYFDRDEGVIWFITSRDTDLVQAVGLGATAHFTFIGKNDDYYACMRGQMEQVEDDAKIDEIWNAVAAAWFEEGREDHEVTLLKFALRDASVWSTPRNPITFGFEIARANMTEDTPHMGAHRVLEWRNAA